MQSMLSTAAICLFYGPLGIDKLAAAGANIKASTWNSLQSLQLKDRTASLPVVILCFPPPLSSVRVLHLFTLPPSVLTFLTPLSNVWIQYFVGPFLDIKEFSVGALRQFGSYNYRRSEASMKRYCVHSARHYSCRGCCCCCCPQTVELEVCCIRRTPLLEEGSFQWTWIAICCCRSVCL